MVESAVVIGMIKGAINASKEYFRNRKTQADLTQMLMDEISRAELHLIKLRKEVKSVKNNRPLMKHLEINESIIQIYKKFDLSKISREIRNEVVSCYTAIENFIYLANDYNKKYDEFYKQCISHNLYVDVYRILQNKRIILEIESNAVLEKIENTLRFLQNIH